MHVVRSLTLVALVLAAACSGSPPPAPAPPAAPAAPAATPAPAPPAGTAYGSPLDQAETLPIADVMSRSSELEGKTVRVEGMVVGVCAKRGCWIEIAPETGPESITFKVEDGVMVFPMSAKGQWAVADGVVRRFPMTLEETREHFAAEAEEAGKTFDPATVTEPAVLVRLDGVGARLRDRK